jgi:hypothetical protein
MGQNTLHWGVLYAIGKVLKCTCRKWPRMSYSHIYNTSYGRKKGREFKSRESTRSWCVQAKCDTPLERSWGELQVCFRLHPNWRSKLGVISSQSIGSPNRNSFETPPWVSWDKKPFGCRCRGQMQRILYGGRWWLPSSSGCGESSESVLHVACPNTKSVSNQLVDWFWCRTE